jgi:hypothetical protein
VKSIFDDTRTWHIVSTGDDDNAIWTGDSICIAHHVRYIDAEIIINALKITDQLKATKKELLDMDRQIESRMKAEARYKEVEDLLKNDSICNLLRYGYKSPSNFIGDNDDCTALNRLYDISNELLREESTNKV